MGGLFQWIKSLDILIRRIRYSTTGKALITLIVLLLSFYIIKVNSILVICFIVFFLYQLWIRTKVINVIIIASLFILLYITLNELTSDLAIVHINKIPENFVKEYSGYDQEVIENRLIDEIQKVDKIVKSDVQTLPASSEYTLGILKKSPNIRLLPYESDLTINRLFQFIKKEGYFQSIFKYKFYLVSGEITRHKMSRKWMLTLRLRSDKQNNVLNIPCERKFLFPLAAEFILKEYDPISLLKYYFITNNLDALSELSNELIELNNNQSFAHIGLGIIYGKQDQTSKAIDEFNLALKYNPKNAEAYYNLGITYYKKNQMDKAITAFKDVAKYKTDYSNAYFNLGLAYKEKGELGQAIDSFTLAAKYKPNDIDMHYELGLAYSNNNSFDKAIKEYELVQGYRPNQADIYNNLGYAYEKVGLIDEAINTYEKAIKIKTDYASAYNNLGNAFLKKHEIDKAIASYKSAIESKHKYVEAYNNLGKAYYVKGYRKTPIKMFELALQYKPDYAEAYNNLGILYFEKNQVSLSIELFKLALKYAPNYAEAFFNLGCAYKVTQADDKVIENFEAAISNRPDFSQAYYNLGIEYSLNGKSDLAINAFKLSIKKKTDAVNSDNNLDLIAKEDIASTDKDAIIYYNLGIAHEEEGNNLDAKQAYEKYLKYSEQNNEITDKIHLKLSKLEKKKRIL
jgi:tetratricopeptide (TPR) repeat protein